MFSNKPAKTHANSTCTYDTLSQKNLTGEITGTSLKLACVRRQKIHYLEEEKLCEYLLAF